MKEYLQKQREALLLMNQIPPESADILAARFFDHKTYQEIGKFMFITKRHAIRKLNEALEAFQQVLNRTENLA